MLTGAVTTCVCVSVCLWVSVCRGGGDNKVVVTAAQVEAWQGATGRNVMAENSQKCSIHSISSKRPKAI